MGVSEMACFCITILLVNLYQVINYPAACMLMISLHLSVGL